MPWWGYLVILVISVLAAVGLVKTSERRARDRDWKDRAYYAAVDAEINPPRKRP